VTGHDLYSCVSRLKYIVVKWNYQARNRCYLLPGRRSKC